MYIFKSFILSSVLVGGFVANSAEITNVGLKRKLDVESSDLEEQESKKRKKISNIDELDQQIINKLESDLARNDINDLDVKETNMNGQNRYAKIIHLAARRGMTSLVLKLLDRGEFLDQYLLPSSTGFTILHAAAYKGYKDLAEQLVKHHSDKAALFKPNENGFTALHNAASFCHPEVAQVLLDSGKTELFKHDISGRTALHIAVQKGCAPLVRMLLEVPGANIFYFMRDQPGKGFPFQVACKTCNNHDVFEAFVGDNVSDLMKDWHLHMQHPLWGYPHHIAAINSNMFALSYYLRCPKLKSILFSQKNLQGRSAYRVALLFKKYRAATFIATMEAIDGVLKNMPVDPLIKDQLWLELIKDFSSLFSRITCTEYNCVADKELYVVFERIIDFVKNKKEDGVLADHSDKLIGTIFRYSKIVPADLNEKAICGKIISEKARGLYNVSILPGESKKILLHSDKCSNKDLKIGDIVYFKKILNGGFASTIKHFHN